MVKDKKKNKIDNENIIEVIKNKKYEVYIDSVILSDRVDYRKIYSLITNSKKGMTIKFIINTPGGDIMTTMQICNALDMCKAKTIAEIHEASSGGAFIAFHCNKIIPMTNCKIMIHTASGSTGVTKFNNIMPRTKHDKIRIDNFIKCSFDKFLTKNELNRVIEGHDLYFLPDEIKKRLAK